MVKNGCWFLCLIHYLVWLEFKLRYFLVTDISHILICLLKVVFYTLSIFFVVNQLISLLVAINQS